MLGGMALSVDGEARELHDAMTCKGVLVQDMPNMAWMFGYTNASWTRSPIWPVSISAG